MSAGEEDSYCQTQVMQVMSDGMTHLLGTSEFLHALAAALISTSDVSASPELRSPLTLAWLLSAMLSC